jgi:HEAT repeat protein
MSPEAIRAIQIATGALGLFLLIVSPQLLRSRLADRAQAHELVGELRGVPAWPDTGPEPQRKEIYARLHALGTDSIPALTRALADPDVNLRRNAALALGVLGEGLAGPPGTSRIDIGAALPALTAALLDPDSRVRTLSEQDLGDIGPAAAAAVPLLVKLLASAEESERNSACIALHDIGSAARPALPALRVALADPSPDVRGFARFAIAAIEGPHIVLLD